MQGLADAFVLMRFAFDSKEALLLNRQIFGTIYFAALEASYELAEQLGPYETYQGSPVSKGVRSRSVYLSKVNSKVLRTEHLAESLRISEYETFLT